MKKINKLRIEFGFFLILILIPFVICYDLDGDGIDDGEQDLCGDGFCQGVSPGEESLSTTFIKNNNETSNNNISQINEPVVNETGNISSNQSNLEKSASVEKTFFVSSLFKIIIFVLILIIIGLIIYFMIRKNKKQDSENLNITPEISNPTEPNVSTSTTLDSNLE